MKSFIRLAAALVAAVGAWAAEPPKQPPSADVVLEWLRYGNERHAQGKYVYWHQSLDRRREVAREERPHAIVLTCSDSRVPPELCLIRASAISMLVRVAGNVAGEKELGSIEYAAQELGAPLVVVLGHQRCSAVHTAVKGGDMAGHIGAIVASLSPAVARAKEMPGDTVDQAIQINVKMTVEQLRNSEPVLGKIASNG